MQGFPASKERAKPQQRERPGAKRGRAPREFCPAGGRERTCAWPALIATKDKTSSRVSLECIIWPQQTRFYFRARVRGARVQRKVSHSSWMCALVALTVGQFSNQPGEKCCQKTTPKHSAVTLSWNIPIPPPPKTKKRRRETWNNKHCMNCNFDNMNNS